jgi:tetraacyldisaccharide-1-P 4'-kinase
MIAGLREWAYRKKLLKPVELPAFTVSVGNISMGGTGKSAFVMLLAEWAAKEKIQAAVLSRGYKRKSSTLSIVGPGENLPGADELGDEPWMIKSRVPAITLVVHHDRARKALRHWDELGAPKLVILDDAFQHWRCARDYDVLMIDATEKIDQKALPFGRLRETVLATRRADLIVVTHASSASPEALTLLMQRLNAASRPRLQPVWKRATRTSPLILAADYEVEGFRDAVSWKPVMPDPSAEYLLVSGIAKPDHLRSLTRRAGLAVKEEIYFPDHHRLTSADKKQIREALSGLRGGRMLITEKDRGRWSELFEEGVGATVICVRFAFLNNGKEELARALMELGRGAGCST